MSSISQAVNMIVSKYDELNDVPSGEIVFKIGQTNFKISKENDDISINYISSANVDYTYSCSNKAEFENFVGSIFA